MKQSREQPIAMDAGVPVEAAVEHRVQLGRRPRLGAGQHMVELVRIFAGDVAERDAGQLRGDLGRKRVLHLQASAMCVIPALLC